MRTTNWNIVNQIRERWVGSEEPALLTGFAQTRLSWARAIESYDQIPQVYRAAFDALPGAKETFPYIVLTPSFEGFIHRETEKLVCSFQDQVYILEKARGKITTTCFRFQDIHYLEVGSILLHSWIRIRGVTSVGALTSISLKFNTVTDYLMTPIVQKARAATKNATVGDLKFERAKFDYLVDYNFKFMNFAKGSIQPGDQVICTVVQPEIPIPMPAFFAGIFYRIFTPAHIGILTNRELILIRDDEEGVKTRKSRQYGGIWNYIALNKITNVSLTEKNADLLTLSIHLPDNDHIDRIFAASNRREVEAFADQLRQIANRLYRK